MQDSSCCGSVILLYLRFRVAIGSGPTVFGCRVASGTVVFVADRVDIEEPSSQCTRPGTVGGGGSLPLGLGIRRGGWWLEGGVCSTLSNNAESQSTVPTGSIHAVMQTFIAAV